MTVQCQKGFWTLHDQAERDVALHDSPMASLTNRLYEVPLSSPNQLDG